MCPSHHWIMWHSLCLALVVGVAAAAKAAEPPAAFLKVGFAERDITPEIGMEQPGGYGKAFHRVIHDPCKVRAAVFDDGKSRVALVGIDALAIRRPTAEAARKAIQASCGIPPQAVMIGASHSHSSGPTCMILPGEFDHASPLVRTLAYEKSSCADPRYLALVEKQIADAVCAANDARVEARCGAGAGIEDKAAFNRRFHMKNGLTWTHPGQNNPEIVEPAGPIDPNVGVIGAWSKEGKLLGCVVNYACHGTTGPSGTSANWIFHLENTIRGAMGKEAIVVFLQGDSGDVTQVDNRNPYVQPGQDRWGEIVGCRVGAEAVKVLVGLHRGALAPLDAMTETLHLNRRVPKPERVKKCLELVQQAPNKVGQTEWTFAKEIVLLDALLAKEPTRDVEVQAIQIGPVVVLSNPAEYFCQLGLDIRAGSPFPITLPVELANDCVGYVPTEEALGPHGGGYETRLTSYSNLEPTAGRQIVEACVRLARQMKPAPIPTPPKGPVIKSPWSYGNVPPEVE
jgi:neutral ceramidase